MWCRHALPPSLQVRSHGACAIGLLGRGGPAPSWRARSLEAGLLRLRAAHARTCPHVGSQLQLGGRSLCLVRLPRAWTHANRQRHACAQHAEAARLAAAHAAPRMHAAHARRTQARGSGMGVVDLRVAHETAGGAREASARRGRVGCGGTARRAALHMRESTHPTAMYVRSLALAALALVGSFALGAASEPAGRAACRTRH